MSARDTAGWVSIAGLCVLLAMAFVPHRRPRVVMGIACAGAFVAIVACGVYLGLI